MPKNLPRDDLFAIFPDLPWPHHRISTIEPMQPQSTVRARANTRRQQAATERVRAAIAGRHNWLEKLQLHSKI